MWNWNENRLTPANLEKASNRTNVELKLWWIWNDRSLERYFQSNQCGIETSKEPTLKPTDNTSNRTNVELKLQKCKRNRLLMKLPIEPMWNWNSLYFVFILCLNVLPIEPMWNWNMIEVTGNANDLRFQSNQCGIETLHKTSLTIFLFNFQSNQCGIETQVPALFPGLWFLPIEPMWNWNLHSLTYRMSQAPFQSNQCGIET